MPKPIWLVWAIAFAGCAAPPPKEEIGVKPPPMAKVSEIDFSRRTEIAIMNDEGTRLGVGEDIERAQDLFPKGSNGKGFADLPPTLDSNVFNAWGWQQKGTAFGAIFDRRARRVALAMRTIQDQGQLAVEELVGRYKNEIGGTTSAELGTGTDPIRYWFWTRQSSHRLMINAVTNRRGGYNVTIAMGEVQVMNAVGASPEKAAEDLSKATNVLERRASSTAGA